MVFLCLLSHYHYLFPVIGSIGYTASMELFVCKLPVVRCDRLILESIWLEICDSVRGGVTGLYEVVHEAGCAVKLS